MILAAMGMVNAAMGMIFAAIALFLASGWGCRLEIFLSSRQSYIPTSRNLGRGLVIEGVKALLADLTYG
jgi:hypothetical protein